MNPHLTRRTLLLGSAATGALAWTPISANTALANTALANTALANTAPATPAFANTLVYDSREAFDTAQAAYLATNAQHNELGLYAWGESYFLLGLLRMYEAYGDLRYLETFELRAAHVMATTDKARGVTDYAGRSAKVWRAAGNYTAGHGVLPDSGGNPAIQLRWAGTRSAESTAEVTNVSGSTFDLILRNPATTTVVTLQGVSLDPTAASYVVTGVNKAYTAGLRWTAVDLRTSPGPATPPSPVTITFQPQFYVFAVHTGMVAFPLARYVRMVLQSPRLRRGARLRKAKEILGAVRAAVAFHDSEYVARPDGSADYVWPKGAPIPFDGTIQPYNQSHGLGQVLVELYRATRERRYRTRVEQLLKAYRVGLTLGADGAYVWPYWPPYSQLYASYPSTSGISEYTPSYPASRQIEDISHAAISLEFVQTAYEAGIDNGLAADVQRFTATFTKKVIRSATEVWLRVDGTAAAVPANAVQCARWGAYAEHDVLVYQQSLRVYDAVQLVPSQGSHALGIAYLNWAKQGAWRKQ